MTTPRRQRTHDDAPLAELIAAFEDGQSFALLGHEDPDSDSVADTGAAYLPAGRWRDLN